MHFIIEHGGGYNSAKTKQLKQLKFAAMIRRRRHVEMMISGYCGQWTQCCGVQRVSECTTINQNISFIHGQGPQTHLTERLTSRKCALMCFLKLGDWCFLFWRDSRFYPQNRQFSRQQTVCYVSMCHRSTKNPSPCVGLIY